MKQKIIIWSAVFLLLLVVAFMVKDFFTEPTNSNENPYEYKMDNLRHIDPSKVGYTEINQIKPESNEISSIAIDIDDNIYITGNSKIIIYDNQFNIKSSLTINSEAKCIHVNDNLIYIGSKDHIDVYDLKGTLLKTWKPINEKSVITSIAANNKFIYVADAGNRIVYQYDKEGNLIKEIGKKNPEKGVPGFVIPSPYFDLLIGRQGELWIVNPGRHSFEQYNDAGDLVSTWTKTSMDIEGFCGCCNPSNIAMLSDGSFVTSEKGIERVKVHLPNGELKTVVATPDSFIEGTKGIDLAVDSKDRIYVLDPEKKVVRIFKAKAN